VVLTGGETLNAREAVDPLRRRGADRVDLGIATWLGVPAAELGMVVLSPAEDLTVRAPGAGETAAGLYLHRIVDDQAAGGGTPEVGLGPQLSVGALAPAVNGAAPHP